MKKVLSITLLLCCMFVSPSAFGQVRKPAQQPSTVKVDGKQAQSLNKDSKLNAPKPQQMNKMDAQEKKVLKDQPASTRVNAEEQRRQQRAADDSRRQRINYENSIERFNNAKRDVDKLLEKQKREREILSEKQAKEAANGLTEEMRQRHETEVKKLEAKHARQLMDAQNKLEKAMREYETASSLYEP